MVTKLWKCKKCFYNCQVIVYDDSDPNERTVNHRDSEFIVLLVITTDSKFLRHIGIEPDDQEPRRDPGNQGDN